MLPRIFLLLLLATPALAQEDDPRRRLVIPAENALLERRFQLAARYVAERKWSEAFDEYQRLLTEGGEALSPCTMPRDEAAGCRRSLQARRLCQIHLAALPPEGLRLLQGRLEPQARKWLEQGQANLDPALLLRLVEEAFCSQETAAALELLGDLAFESGDLEGAQNWWQMLSPSVLEPPLRDGEGEKKEGGRLRHPAPGSDLARIHARQILTHIFQGERELVLCELAAFQTRHGQARGELAGEKGVYADILQKWLQKGRPLHDAASWPTLGGGAARNAAVADLPPGSIWSRAPAWRVRLKPPPPVGQVRMRAPQASQLAFFPVIAGGQVLVSDGAGVRSFDLQTGRLVFHYEAPAGWLNPPAQSKKGSLRLPRHTLTAGANGVYAVLGEPIAAHEAPAAETPPSYLVCLDTRPGQVHRKRWAVRAQWTGGTPGAFDAAPLFHDGRLYVVLRRHQEGRLHLAVACLEADSGKELWQTPLAAIPALAERETPVVSQRLLTLAGQQVICCTNNGLVAGVCRRTGRLAWVVHYPSRGPTTSDSLASPRELGNCLHAHDRIYVAPLDSDGLLCLDPDTGAVLWHRLRIDVVHLLGCSQGRLIFTTPIGLRALDALTGSDEGGWLQPGEGRLPPMGRGLMAGGWVIWPTAHPELPLRLVHASSGYPEYGELAFEPVRLRHLVAGNIALGGGCLVVATGEELVGYVADKAGLGTESPTLR